jgi:glycerate kinase
MHVLAAPDKFRGTASARQVAQAIGEAVAGFGGTCTTLPLADGGEGTLDAFGGPNRWTEVSGPLGGSVRAGWRLDEHGRAVIEMAKAAGLTLAGGKAGNDVMTATTRGVGELIAAAIQAGARRVLVGMGGSATTDGGAGAVSVLEPFGATGVEVVVCCDVATSFVESARQFGPQKGATLEQIDKLTARLTNLTGHYRDTYGVELAGLAGAGAAGGLGGGLAVLGARLVPGFPVIAEEAGLGAALVGADLVVTGEGLLDAASFEGKVVGGVTASAMARGIASVAVVGAISPEVRGRVPALALTDYFARDECWAATSECVRSLTARYLRVFERRYRR